MNVKTPHIVKHLFFLNQWRLVLNAFEANTLPLFLRLIFSEVVGWRSYWVPESTVIPSEITTTIIDMFEQVERKYGVTLVKHALRYSTRLWLFWGGSRPSKNPIFSQLDHSQ